MPPIFYVVDVRHGNSAVLCGRDGVAIIDTGVRQRLLQFLRAHEICEINTVIISHADRDHCAGLIDLLLAVDIRIGTVRLNSDTTQESAVWEDMLIALSQAEHRAGTAVRPGLHSDLPDLDIGEVRVEVLSPTPIMAARGVGGQGEDGANIDRHAMNAVVGLCRGDHRFALISGDISLAGLETMSERCGALGADILVFPHHGGRAGGGEPSDFARRVCALVSPTFVVFSVPDGNLQFPREEVLLVVEETLPGTLIFATGDAPTLASLIESNDECGHRNATGTIEWSIGTALGIPSFRRDTT